jgi:hypothetical protein
VEPSPNDVNRLFEEDTTETPQATPTPATEAPAGDVDDLFPDTTEQPAADNLDDLFGPAQGDQTEGAASDRQPPSEVQPAAAETPAENADDLFGDTSSQGDEAAEGVKAGPSTSDGMEDVFAPSAVEDTQVQPAAAQEEASADAEDLFADPGPGDSNPSGAPPANTAPADMDANDLFNDSSTRTEQPAPNADNSAPLDEQPVGTITADDSMAPRAAPAEAVADSSVQPQEPAKTTQLAAQDIRQPVRAMAVPIAHVDGTVNAQLGTRPVDGGPLPMRRWTDNTGIYRTTAQLVEVGDASVRLLKDTGRFTTVPLRRLSPADLRYVQQHSATSLDEAAHVALR